MFLITDHCPLIPDGAIAQLGERLLCKQEVVGSIPSGSTSRIEGARRISSAEKLFSHSLPGRQARDECVLSDIVKRGSIRASRVTKVIGVAQRGRRGLTAPSSGRSRSKLVFQDQCPRESRYQVSAVSFQKVSDH